MKKYLSFFLAFSLVFAFSFTLLPFSKVEAARNTCAPGVTYNEDRTPCSIIAVCLPGVAINHITGDWCPGMKPTSAHPLKTFAQFIADTLTPISYGSKKNWDVAAVQAFLSATGTYPASLVTGNYLSYTKSQIKKFQAGAGLTADGIAGSRTIKAIKELVARNNNVATRIATSLGGASVNRTPATAANNPGSTTVATAPVCDAPHPGTGPQQIQANITTDNWLLMYAWDKETKELRFLHADIVRPPLTTRDLDTDMPWQTAERFNFTLGTNEHLIWVAPNDMQVDNSIIGDFLLPSGAISLTKAGIFEHMETSMAKPNTLNGLATNNNADIKRELENGTWKLVTTERGPMGMAPWGGIPGISTAAKWLDTVGVETGSNKISIFRTKYTGDGALPPCDCPPGSTGAFPDCGTPVPDDTCPVGYTGTPPNCVPPSCPPGMVGTPPNCQEPEDDCPPGTVGTPPNCVPPPGTESVTGSCRGVAWPDLEFVITVKFTQPVLITGTPVMKVLGAPNDHGVEVPYVSSSADKMTLTFRYVPPTAGSNPYASADYTGNGNIGFKLPLSSGVSIKRASDGVAANLAGQWAIPADATKCLGTTTTPPAVVSSSVVSCATQTQAWPDLKLIVTMTFNKEVTVNGNPKMEVVPSGSVPGVPFNYVSGSGSKILIFETPTPAPGVLNPYPYDSYIGSGVRFRPFDATNNIKVQGTPTNVDTTTGSPWPIPGALSKCINPGIAKPLTSTASCTGTTLPTLGISITVEFDQEVTVAGVPEIKINNGATGVVLKYISGSGTKFIKFTYTPPATNPYALTDYTGNGTFSINLPSGALIKNKVSPFANANLAGGPWTIPANMLASCPITPVDVTPATIASTTGSCVGNAYPNFGLTINVNFNKAVTVAGVAPKLKIISTNTGEGGAFIPYDSGSGTTTLVFKTTNPVTGSYASYLGNKFEFVNGANIKTGNVSANVSGQWNVPLDTKACIAPTGVSPRVNGIEGFYRGSNLPGEGGYSVNYHVTFDQNITVIDDDVALKITNATGQQDVSAYFLSVVNGNTLKFHANYQMPLTPPISLGDFEGHGTIYVYGASSIRSTASGVDAILSIPENLLYDDPYYPVPD